MCEQGGYCIRCCGHVGVAKSDEERMLKLRDQIKGCFKHRHQTAFGADQTAGKMIPMLGQQVFEAVTGNLTAETAKLGSHGGEVAAHKRIEPIDRSEVVCGGEASAEAVNNVEALHIVCRAPKLQRVGSARVIADHSAKGAAGRSGWVGAEA